VNTTSPKPRYGPGADLLGCTVVLDDPDNGRMILRCPGLDKSGCDVAFEVERGQCLRSQAKGLVYLCNGCGGGQRPMSTPGPKPRQGPRLKTATGSLLLAAAGRFGAAEFTVWELVVAAWEADPARWGLPGFELLYPCSNGLKVELYKRNETGFRNYVKRVGKNRYCLLPQGLAAAKKLRAAR
jgi:hypothetical protein